MTEPTTRQAPRDTARPDRTGASHVGDGNGSPSGRSGRDAAPIVHGPLDLDALYHALNGGGVRVVGRGTRVAGRVTPVGEAKQGRPVIERPPSRHRRAARVRHPVRPRPRATVVAPRTGHRTVSWRQALAAGIVCFAVWLVLDAPTLLRSAEAGPLGVRRTVAVTVLRPIDDLSRALGLSHVVGAADRAIGRRGTGVLQVEGPPVRRHRSTPSGPGAPTSGRRFLGYTSVTAPDGLRPPAAPSAAAPLQALAVGDSLGIDFGQSLVNDLAATGVVHAILDGHIDTGLSRPDYFDWQAELQADLARYQPQAVVVFIGANDPQNFIDGGSALAYGTQAWSDAYARRVGAFMQAATSAHARVLWVGMPPMADATLNGKMQVLNAIYQSEASAHPGVTYFPSWSVLSGGQGGFAAFLPDASGNEVAVREPDGTHISAAGAERLARAAIADLDHAWGLSL
jgi:hypothetical protein